MSFNIIDQLLSPVSPLLDSKTRSQDPELRRSPPALTAAIAPDRPLTLASALRPPSDTQQLRGPAGNPELQPTIQQLLEDLAARMERSVARQISALEERLRASPPRCPSAARA
jgi:hypothetical protein